MEDDAIEDVPGDIEDAAETPDADQECPSGGFEAGGIFDSAYVCSDYLGSTARSVNIDGLTNAVLYKFAVVAFDDYRNPSPISAVACATPKEVDDFWKKYKDSGGGAEGGFCFVATAAYGSPLHPFVKHLKMFRDDILLKTSAGRAFVDFYYEKSPPAAAAIERSPVLKTASQIALVPAVVLAWTSVGLVHHPEILLVLLGAVLLAVRLGRRRR